MSFFGAAKLKHHESPRSARLVLSLFILALYFCFTPPTCVRAQTGQPTPDDVIRVETNLVTVPVIVTDNRGRRIHGLTTSDFEVRDEGRGVEVAYFAAGAERVALLFLLDASGSTRDLIAQQSEAAIALFARFGSRSRLSLMHFQERPELTLSFTNDQSVARQAFKGISRPDRRTAIFDAAYAGARAFRTSGASPAERRIVIMISDGLDTASTIRPVDCINEAVSNDVTFYVIHTPLFAPRDGRLKAREPSKGFRDLAEKTGGQFFVVGDAQASLSPRPSYDLQPIFQAIEDDLRGQYVLGYHASGTEQTKRLHRVDVLLKPQAGRKLRVRQLRRDYFPNNPQAGHSKQHITDGSRP